MIILRKDKAVYYVHYYKILETHKCINGNVELFTELRRLDPLVLDSSWEIGYTAFTDKDIDEEEQYVKMLRKLIEK